MVGSRFQVVTHPAFAPGEDAITRSTVGPFVDTGTWLQPNSRRSRLYLSVETIRELAEVAGIVSISGASELELAQARAEGALAVLKENLGADLALVLRRLGDLVPASRGLGSLADGEDAGTAELEEYAAR